MVKLTPMSAREVERTLARAGFVTVRSSGHRIWQMDSRIVRGPRHPGDIPLRTLRSIISLAGMTVEEFVRYRSKEPKR